jgi:hypothetical protein
VESDGHSVPVTSRLLGYRNTSVVLAEMGCKGGQKHWWCGGVACPSRVAARHPRAVPNGVFSVLGTTTAEKGSRDNLQIRTVA